MPALNTIDEILEDLRLGKMAVIMDDEDRENEGDLIMAADCVRPQDVNFMARYGRGLICLTLTRERCRQLRLPLMVSDTDSTHRTNFTLTIEAAEGVTTGISAHDRAHTIKTAVAPDARPEDLRQPGHVFPLMAQPGGVLTRAGHTEAGCDLARLAGLEPAAVIVEILNDDGGMARRDDLLKFARRHNLKIGTIADLIEYRLRTEQSVEIISESSIATQFGEFRLVCLEDHVNRAVHLALVRGKIDPKTPTLVRVHRQDTLADVIGVQDPSLHRPLRDALAVIAAEERGVVVLLRLEESARDLMHAVQSLSHTEPEPDKCRDRQMDFRMFGIGAQILRAVGVRRMRVLGAPKHMHALSGFGLEITEYVSADPAAERGNVHG